MQDGSSDPPTAGIDDGVINEDEYRNQRQRILDEI